jgi:hypothetical protein
MWIAVFTTDTTLHMAEGVPEFFHEHHLPTAAVSLLPMAVTMKVAIARDIPPLLFLPASYVVSDMLLWFGPSYRHGLEQTRR